MMDDDEPVSYLDAALTLASARLDAWMAAAGVPDNAVGMVFPYPIVGTPFVFMHGVVWSPN